jgi:hypothetical protein
VAFLASAAALAVSIRSHLQHSPESRRAASGELTSATVADGRVTDFGRMTNLPQCPASDLARGRESRSRRSGPASGLTLPILGLPPDPGSSGGGGAAELRRRPGYIGSGLPELEVQAPRAKRLLLREYHEGRCGSGRIPAS